MLLLVKGVQTCTSKRAPGQQHTLGQQAPSSSPLALACIDVCVFAVHAACIICELQPAKNDSKAINKQLKNNCPPASQQKRQRAEAPQPPLQHIPQPAIQPGTRHAPELPYLASTSSLLLVCSFSFLLLNCWYMTSARLGSACTCTSVPLSKACMLCRLSACQVWYSPLVRTKLSPKNVFSFAGCRGRWEDGKLAGHNSTQGGHRPQIVSRLAKHHRDIRTCCDQARVCSNTPVTARQQETRHQCLQARSIMRRVYRACMQGAPHRYTGYVCMHLSHHMHHTTSLGAASLPPL